MSSGIGIGFYFGFRCGVVSEKARNYVSSLPFMNAVCCQNNAESSISLYQVPAPQHLKSNEVMITLTFVYQKATTVAFKN